MSSTDWALLHASQVRREWEEDAAPLPKLLRASDIALRRAEEEGAEAFFPLRATTTAADSKRDARAAAKGPQTCRWLVRGWPL